MLKTPFWQRAAASLPAHVRERYAADLEFGERCDLAVSAMFDWLERRGWRSRVAGDRPRARAGT
jgi:hypothetical protein